MVPDRARAKFEVDHMFQSIFRFFDPRTTIMANAAAGMVIVIATLMAFFWLEGARSEDRRNSEDQIAALYLIEALRHSSDSLTRLARTYVSTGEERYRRLYDLELEVRKGRVPPPDDHDLVSLDLMKEMGVLAEHPVSSFSIVERARSLGLTHDEMEYLGQALELSNRLAVYEKEAMDLAYPERVVGLPPIGTVRERDWLAALGRLYNKTYEEQKQRIMQSVNALYDRASTRFAERRNLSDENVKRAEWGLAVCTTFLAVLVVLSAFTVRIRFIEPIEAIGQAMARMSGGRMHTPIPFVERTDEIGILARSAESFRVGSARMLRVANMELFLCVVYHDLKEPLKKMGALAQIRNLDTHEENERFFAEQVEQACRRMVSLVDSLRELVRIGADGIGREEFDLAVVWSEAVRDVLGDSRSNAMIENQVSGLAVSGDRSLILQLFVNLLRNALVHGEKPAKIELSSQCIGPIRIYCVSNNTSMHVSNAETLFQPFKRGDGKVRDKSRMGLGLAISKRIVELHGGRIWIDQDKTGVFSVKFTLDVAWNAAAAAGSGPPFAPPAGTKGGDGQQEGQPFG
ncbi:MAG: HAMP domain-containing sensor histidine kinase [Geminicoccaceae bacterium]